MKKILQLLSWDALSLWILFLNQRFYLYMPDIWTLIFIKDLFDKKIIQYVALWKNDNNLKTIEKKSNSW